MPLAPHPPRASNDWNSLARVPLRACDEPAVKDATEFVRLSAVEHVAHLQTARTSNDSPGAAAAQRC
eukprot:2149235-Pleurochrysis_carterae.AAC.1